MEDAIARMNAIRDALPASDGVACFNRIYLMVTEQVQGMLGQTQFADPAFVARLDVIFANMYFDALRGPPAPAWKPLFDRRDDGQIEPIQFALAGMNAHINHDLPLAVVNTCLELGTSPEQGSHHADYQKVDVLLDAAEQDIRQSFESGVVLEADQHAQRVLTVVGNWTMNSARDVAWDTALALWKVRRYSIARNMLMDALARTVGMASRGLLVAV